MFPSYSGVASYVTGVLLRSTKPTPRAIAVASSILLLWLSLFGCGGSSSPPTPSSGSGPVVAADHVFIVVLENHGFDQVIGSPSMPYLNSLATQHGLATGYFANAHPSIPNYFMLATGNIETLDDNFTGTVSDNNIVRALTSSGKTWKAYIEDLPSAGYTGPSTGLYLKRHNPFAYLSDVTGSSAQAANMVPFSQLAADLAAGPSANFVYILPNSQDDGHDCPGGAPTCTDAQVLTAVDNWLMTNIDPVIHSSNFGNSLLVITWDESVSTDSINGGGHIATVLVGPHTKSGFRSATTFQHQSLLRLALDSLRVSNLPGASAGAPSMGDFLQ